jgi:transposase-like protein
MNKKQVGSQDRYPPDLKIAVAREYQKGEVGYGKLGQKYGYGTETIRAFVKWYKIHYPDPDIERDAEVEPKADQGLTTADKKISHDLELANLKIAALEMLIENTNKELGYDIGKKAGTGQSSK